MARNGWPRTWSGSTAIRSEVIGLVNRTAIISMTRLMNQGLVIISPIILVRLLSVAEFGRYREFLLYVSLLSALAAFGFSTSLLYFVPARPRGSAQVLRQTLLLTGVSSFSIVALVLALHYFVNSSVLGEFALPVALYVLLFVNFDVWESWWLAHRRALPVLAYTSGRLVARMVVVIVAAAIWHDVQAIIAGLIVLESVRLAGSFVAWRRLQRGALQDAPCWREQLRYCLPVGAALVLVTFNKYLGNLFVATMLGAVALAHYTIGTQVQPIITVLRNSLSDALLPEMAATSSTVARRSAGAGTNDPLILWRRTTVVSMILLTGAGVVLARFAHPLVVTLFSPEYEPAVPVFQIYLLVLLREVFDFGVPLRAINHTRPIVWSNLVAIVCNLACLAILLPALGLTGAVVAFVISRYLEGVYIGRCCLQAYAVPLREMASWRDLGKVALAAVLALPALLGSFWVDRLGLLGVVLGSSVYLLLFALWLLMLRVPEVWTLARRVKDSRLILQKF